MKKYTSLLENNKQLPLSTFDQLAPAQYLRLFHQQEALGYYRVEQAYNTNPELPGLDTAVVQKLDDYGQPVEGLFTIRADDPTYTFQILQIRHSAGILFEYKQKLLLVHPTGKPKTKSYSYPKGNAEPGETYVQTAVREVKEETGIDYPTELLQNKPLYSIQSFRWDALKIQYYYLIHLTAEDYNKYIGTQVVTKENLQLAEIDWAGFVPLAECKNLLKDQFEVILYHF